MYMYMYSVSFLLVVKLIIPDHAIVLKRATRFAFREALF